MEGFLEAPRRISRGLQVGAGRGHGESRRSYRLMQTMQTPNRRILTYMYGGVGGRRKMSSRKAYEEII